MVWEKFTDTIWRFKNDNKCAATIEYKNNKFIGHIVLTQDEKPLNNLKQAKNWCERKLRKQNGNC